MTRKILLISIVSALIGVVYVLHFGVNIPIWDEWNNIDFIRKIYTHQMTLNDFFIQLNEHRILLVRLLIWLEVQFGLYYPKFQMITSIFVIIATILVYLLYISKSNKNLKLVYFIPVPFILLSTRQYDNMLWGIQLNAIISYLFPVFCFYLLDKLIINNSRRISIIGWIILIGFLSSFSQINGLIVWPILIFFSLLYLRDFRLLLPIILFALLSFFLYFYSYNKPSSQPDFDSIINFTQFFQYFLNLLGGSIFYKIKHALIFGSIVLVTVIILIVKLTLKKQVKNNLFPIMVLLYSFCTMLLISFGRFQFELITSLFSRYTTISLLSLVSIYIIILNMDIKVINYYPILPVLLIILLSFSNYRFMKVSKEYRDQRLEYVEIIKNYETRKTELKRICFSEELIIKELDYNSKKKRLFKLD